MYPLPRTPPRTASLSSVIVAEVIITYGESAMTQERTSTADEECFQTEKAT